MANQPITFTVNVATKQLTLSGALGLRELIDVSLVSSSPSVNLPGTATNYAMYIQQQGVTLAQCTSFTAGSPVTGILDLSAAALVSAFAGLSDSTVLTFRCLIWDATDQVLVADDNIQIENNTAPYTLPNGVSIGSLVINPAMSSNVNYPVPVCIDANGYANLCILGQAGNIYGGIASCVGMAISASYPYVAGQTVQIVQAGIVTCAAWAWCVGGPVYMDGNGGLTQSPNVNGQLLRVGVALSATQMWLTMWPGASGQTGAASTVPGPQGPQGLQGVPGVGQTGAQGAAGVNGSTWYNYAGVPTGGSVPAAVNGDYCLDTADLLIYQKQSGSWVLVATFIPNTAYTAMQNAVLANIASTFAATAALSTNATGYQIIAQLNAILALLKGL